MRMARALLTICLTLTSPVGWTLGFSGTDLEGLPCKGGAQGFGPFDYTNPEHVRKSLNVVESYHFTPEVEQLIRGKSGGLAADLDYTLRAFPNHHRALFSVIRLTTGHRQKGRHEGELPSKPECYLQRALRFKPDDGVVHMLFGIYLHRLGKLDEAEQRYWEAVKLQPANPEVHYNLGLLLVDQERFDEAVPVAKQAYKLGYPLKGLQRRLAKAGHPLTN